MYAYTAREQFAGSTFFYSLLPTPYSLLPTPYSLLPTPYSLITICSVPHEHEIRCKMRLPCRSLFPMFFSKF
jgi:hypothetical protein